LPKGMAKGANIEKGRWSGHGSFSEEQIDELNVKFSADDTSYGENVASAKKLAVKAKKAGATVDRKSWDPRNVSVTGNASAIAKIKRKMGRRYDAHMSEEQIDEVSKRLLGRYIKKAHVSGLEAASQGEVAYANKDKAGLRKANKTGEKREQGINLAATKLAREEYEKQEAGVKKRSGETHTLHRRNPGHKTEYHTITTERDGRKSVKTGSPKYIKKHWDKMEEEKGDKITSGTGIPNFTQKNLQDVAKDLGTGQGGATFAMKSNSGTPSRQVNVSTDPAERGNKFTNRAPLDEKAPPGAKFERMVKHIKKGYAKDGELTKKEKGIAFATAWKAKNREKGE